MERIALDRWVAVTVLATVGLFLVVATPEPAAAACHNADFRRSEQTVDEDGGEATVVVFLVGEQPTCSGSVRYETVDGSARAGSDYRSRSGELTFAPGDDREETITIPIIDDGADEPLESFTVRLSPGSQPGNISPTTLPATISIRDDDAPASTPAATETPPDDPGPTSTPTSDESSPTPTPTITDEPSPSPSPEPTGVDDTLAAAPGDDDGGGNGAAVILGVVLALAAAGGGAWFWRRRAASGA